MLKSRNDLVVLLLGSLALVHPPEDLFLVVLDRLVDLSSARRLVAVHLGRQGGIMLASDLLRGLLLSAAIAGVVLVVGCGKPVGYAALVLFIASRLEIARRCIHWSASPATRLTRVVFLVGILLALLEALSLLLLGLARVALIACLVDGGVSDFRISRHGDYCG